MSEIVWTKEWSSADDGTIVSGQDLANIQSDIGVGVTTNATSIQGISVDAPEAGDDGSYLFYDHGNLKFDYAVPPAAAIPLSYLDTDNTLAADSDVKVPSQKAIKKYVDDAAVTPAFGVWGSVSTSTSPIQATADGFLVGWWTSTVNDAGIAGTVKTDAANPPTTVVTQCALGGGPAVDVGSKYPFCTPVKNTHY